MLGHLLGAAGSVEAVISVKAIEEGVAPPTINLEHPDPQCDLDYIPEGARELDIKLALSNSFGFGGPMPPCCSSSSEVRGRGLIFLSDFINAEVVDVRQHRVGRVRDLVVVMAEPFPRVTGVILKNNRKGALARLVGSSQLGQQLAEP